MALCFAAIFAVVTFAHIVAATIVFGGLGLWSAILAGRRLARGTSCPTGIIAAFALLFLGVVALGWFRLSQAAIATTLPATARTVPVRLTATVESLQHTANSFRLVVSGVLNAVGGTNTGWKGRFIVYPPREDTPVRVDICDVVEVRGSAEPFVARTNPGGFDARFYWQLRGVAGSLQPDGPNSFVVKSAGCRGPVQWLRRVRENLRRRFRMALTRGLGPGLESIVRALVLGDRSGVPRDTVAAFSAVGVIHVLAVSGLHVGYVGNATTFLGHRLGVGGALQPLASMVPVIAFVGLAGAPASAVRAAIMFSLLALATRLLRPGSSINFAGGAALALVLWRPLYVFDVGFQLSMGATLGIMLWQGQMNAVLQDAVAWCAVGCSRDSPGGAGSSQALGYTDTEPPGGWEALAAPAALKSMDRADARQNRLQTWLALGSVTLAAQLGTLPVIAAQFHQFSLLGVVANIILVPLVGKLFTVLLVALLVSFVSISLAVPLLWLLRLPVFVFVTAVRTLSWVPLGTLYVPHMPTWIVPFYYASLVVLVGSYDRLFHQTRVGRMIALFTVVLMAAWLAVPPWGSGQLAVVFLDVGQADAALIHTPCGETVVVDTGDADTETDRDAGRDIVIPALYDLRWTRVDWLIVSHWHDDHAGGAAALIEAGLVSRVAVTGGTALTDDERNLAAGLLSTATQHGTPLVLWGQGEHVDLGCGAQLSVLYPRRQGRVPGASEFEDSGSPNNRSLVLRLQYGAFSALFVGDLESEGEQSLVREGCESCLQSTVLKVGHHGSATSTTPTLVDAVRPALSVISVGPNPYRFPAPSVVDRLREAGSRVLRTDQCGAVTIVTDGKGVRVMTELRGCS